MGATGAPAPMVRTMLQVITSEVLQAWTGLLPLALVEHGDKAAEVAVAGGGGESCEAAFLVRAPASTAAPAAAAAAVAAAGPADGVARLGHPVAHPSASRSPTVGSPCLTPRS